MTELHEMNCLTPTLVFGMTTLVLWGVNLVLVFRINELTKN